MCEMWYRLHELEKGKAGRKPMNPSTPLKKVAYNLRHPLNADPLVNDIIISHDEAVQGSPEGRNNATGSWNFTYLR